MAKDPVETILGIAGLCGCLAIILIPTGLVALLFAIAWKVLTL